MFNEIIVSNFSNPRHAGEIDDATNVIELGNPVCGDRIQVQLRIRDGVIEHAVYSAWGCATSLATGNVFCSRVLGMPLETAGKLADRDIDDLLGELEPAQHHCLEMLHALFDELQGIARADGQRVRA